MYADGYVQKPQTLFIKHDRNSDMQLFKPN